MVDGKYSEEEGIDIAPGQSGYIELSADEGMLVENIIRNESDVIRSSMRYRNNAFGSTENSRLDPNLLNFICGSISGALELDNSESFSRNVNHFDSSGGMDTQGLIGRGGAVLFLLVADHAPIPSTGLFETKLGQAWTLYRIPLELPDSE